MSAQPAETELKPGCGGVFDLCGFIDATSGVEVIPRHFEFTQPFYEGLAAVRIEGHWGYVDPAGEVVIALRFEQAGPFQNGFAEVVISNRTGAIDRTGQVVIEPLFARVVPFAGDVFFVTDGEETRMLREREEPFGGATIGLRSSGLYRLGEGWIVEPGYEFRFFDTPKQGAGLVWARTTMESTALWGLLASDGTWVVSPRYEAVQPVSEGRAVVRGASGPMLTHPLSGRPVAASGALDETGQLAVPLTFAALGSWHDGYGVAQGEAGEALLRPDGTLLGDRWFDEVDRGSKGSLPRVRDGVRWFSIAPDGSLQPDQRDGQVIVACSSGLTLRHRGEGFEFTHPALPAPLLSTRRPVDSFARLCENPVSFAAGGKYGFVFHDGHVVFDPPIFENQIGFLEGTAAVKLDGLWGLVDEAGTFLLPPQFDDMRVTVPHYTVTKGARSYTIDATGTEVALPTGFSDAQRAAALACREGSRLFTEDGHWGLGAADGTILIAPVYRALGCYDGGIAWGAAEGASQWCPIGPDGQERRSPDCRTAVYPFIWSHYGPERLDPDPFESSVLWNRAYRDFGAGLREDPPWFVGDGVQGHGRVPALPFVAR